MTPRVLTELLQTPVKTRGVITWVPELRECGPLYGGARLMELADTAHPYQVERVAYFVRSGSKVCDLR